MLHNPIFRFLQGGGHMAGHIAERDWSDSPLGPPESWSPALKATLGMMLPARAEIVLFWGPDYVALYNDAYAPTIGNKHPWALGRPAREGWAELWDDLGPLLRQVRATGQTVSARDRPFYIERFGVGETVYFDISYSPVREATGAVGGVLCIVSETTSRVHAQHQLRSERERLAQLFRQAPSFMALLEGPAHIFTFTNPAYEQLIGHRPVLGQTIREALPEVVAQGFPDLLDQVYRSGESHAGKAVPVTLQRDPGAAPESRVLDFVYQPVKNASGDVTGIFVTGTDVTEMAEAQTALKRLNQTLESRVEQRTEELLRAQAALQQAQKMEAIGNLTGGIAHDFNNLLMAVIGSMELLKRRVPDDPAITRLIGNAMEGARRGATLTRRMLAFARRQDLKSEHIDLALLVDGMTELMQRALGPTIQVKTDFPANLPSVHTDPHQLESALLNLALNARDAMHGEGRIVIAARRGKAPATLDPGDYVCLSVADTGEGMNEDVLKRAIEPFFTTKGVGKGTGLGLSMVQGLAAQSGGALILSSEPGHGTRAEIWLPAADGAVERPAMADAAPAPHKEVALKVLAVDDDPLVLMMVVDMLEELGHSVTSANSAAEALELLRAGYHFDLVLSDHAMPQMTGSQLAEEALRQSPGLKILLATGYAELPPGADIGLPRLAKPFTQDQLGAAIAGLG